MIEIVTAVGRMVGGEPVHSPVPLPAGVVLRRSRLVPRLGGWLAGMAAPAAAVTLGRSILVDPGVEPSARLLRHELAHVRQWERDPRVFPFRYISAHIRHGYGGNPFEAEARAAETGRMEHGGVE